MSRSSPDSTSPNADTFVEADATSREMRDLRNTITALRQAVEEARSGADQRVRDAISGQNYEISQLKATTAALRDALEQERADKDKRVREALRAASDEIVQLKAVVAALRETLEKKGSQ